jgi:hypothetical protein
MKVKSMIIEKKMNPNRYILIFLILISINSCCTFCNLSTCKEKSTVVFNFQRTIMHKQKTFRSTSTKCQNV